MCWRYAGALALLASLAACLVELGEPRGNALEDAGGGNAGGGDATTPIADAGGGEDVAVPPLPKECPAAQNHDPDLLAYYPFEEEDGERIVDCSGHGIDGVLRSGSSRRAIAGHFGRALELDGATCFDLGAPGALTYDKRGFTVMAWIKPRSYAAAGGEPRWFMTRGEVAAGVFRGWGIGVDDPRHVEMKSYDADGGFNEATAEIRQPGNYVHVAGVYGGGTLSVFIEGEIRNLIQVGHPAFQSAEVRAWVGCGGEGRSGFDGEVDELRVFGRALTLDEIIQVRNRTAP